MKVDLAFSESDATRNERWIVAWSFESCRCNISKIIAVLNYVWAILCSSSVSSSSLVDDTQWIPRLGLTCEGISRCRWTDRISVATINTTELVDLDRRTFWHVWVAATFAIIVAIIQHLIEHRSSLLKIIKGTRQSSSKATEIEKWRTHHFLHRIKTVLSKFRTWWKHSFVVFRKQSANSIEAWRRELTRRGLVTHVWGFKTMTASLLPLCD